MYYAVFVSVPLLVKPKIWTQKL